MRAASLGEWNAGLDVDLPPPRGWLLGNTFCRGFVSSLLGDGGTGKTSLRCLQAVSLASGHRLTGEHIFQRTRVLLISLEDDARELRRRILAARITSAGASPAWPRVPIRCVTKATISTTLPA